MGQGVTAEQMLEHLNKVLSEQPSYRPEMKFLASPRGSRSASIWGYATSTPYTEDPAYHDAEMIVREQWHFDPRKE